MDIDLDFAKDIAQGMNTHLAAVVPTEPRFVKLGYGDGSGRIVKDRTKRQVYYFEGDLGDFQRGQGVAYLPPGRGIELQDGKNQEGLDIEIRRSSGNVDQWEVYQVRAAAFSGTDGRLPSEQKVDRVAQPTLAQIDAWRPVSTGTLAFLVKGSFTYTDPTTGLVRTVYDPVGTVATQVAALSSGQHQAAVLYFNASTGLLGVATNTASTAGGTLPSRGEFYDFTFANITRPANALVIGNVYLYYGQTQLAEADFYRTYDPRPLFEAPRDTWASLTTTNNTTTTITSVTVAELSAITITGEYVASKSDYTASAGGTFRYTVRRASGGNVTQIAAATISQDDDSIGAPVISLDVDTGAQTARVRATGITAETWYWRVSYRVAKT